MIGAVGCLMIAVPVLGYLAWIANAITNPPRRK